MSYVSLVIIGVVVAISFLFWIAKREAQKHGTGTGEEFIGICKSVIETASQKEARKESALALLRERSNLSNADIRQDLRVSSRTVVRYLDELEAEEKVVQVGKIGHSVTYRLK